MKKIFLFFILFLSFANMAEAQKDYSFRDMYFWLNGCDSITIHVLHLHTQAIKEDSLPIYVNATRYLTIEDSMIYAIFPANYEVYRVANFATGQNNLVDKPMIVKYTFDNQGGYGTRIWRTYDLLGKKVAICRIDTKGVMLDLSL